MVVPDDPLREDALVPDPPDDPLREDALDPDEPEDVLPDVDDATSAVALDDRPTTELPKVAASPAPQRGWTAGLGPWAVFAAVGVVVIIATSTWAAWLQGPTSDRNAAVPRIDPVPILTSPAPQAPETVAPPPEPEPVDEPEPEPEPEPDPVARVSEPRRPTRERAAAPRVDTPPPPAPPSPTLTEETSGAPEPPPADTGVEGAGADEAARESGGDGDTGGTGDAGAAEAENGDDTSSTDEE